MRMRTLFAVITLLAVALAIPAGAAGPTARKPAAGDKCPVCGMFVAKYPDFAAQMQFKNGSVLHFDGAKDMFKYYLSPGRYLTSRKQGDPTTIHVTSYYSLAPIDGRTAWYVVGSDVFGPMGRELIPFGNEAEAREFLKDHKGKRLLRFGEVTAAIVRELD